MLYSIYTEQFVFRLWN